MSDLVQAILARNQPGLVRVDEQGDQALRSILAAALSELGVDSIDDLQFLSEQDIAVRETG